MNGRLVRLLAVLALVVGLSLFAISSVSAHHPIVDGSAVCQPNGTWLITWTLRNSESASGTNRWMDVDQINRTVTGIVVGTRVHPQGSATHPTGTVSGTETLPGNTTGNITLTVRVDFQGDGPDNVVGSKTINLNGSCVQNTASVTPVSTCEGWSLTINATPGYTVTGATSGSWNGEWSVNYSITVNYSSGTPTQFPFSGTITRDENCQTNTVTVTPATTCEGWSLTVNASAGATITGATSGSWNGEWSVNYSILVTFDHGVPNSFPFTGTLTRSQECQQNSAEVTPVVTCEGWSLTINATPGYTVTGETSGSWNGAWSANYSISLTYSNGVPPQFTFSGTVNRSQECQQNFADVTPTANCVTWELVILASEGVSVQSGATAGVWQPGEWSVNYDVTLAFANGVPQTLHFTGTINRPAECQQNAATFTPTVTCEGWSVVVNASEGATVTGATSGGWDENGQGMVSIMVTWAQGEPLQVPYTNVLNKPTEGCDPEETPEPTPEVTPSPTPEGTPPATPPPTPAPPPPTYCIIPGSEAWDVDVTQLTVYGHPMVSRDQNTGVVNIHSLDAEVFIPGTRIPLTWGDQTVYVWLTYNADRTCTPDPVLNPPMPEMPEIPCPDCEAWVCEGFRTSGAEVVTFPLPGSTPTRYAVIARDVQVSIAGADVNVVHGNTYQIFWYISAAERDLLLAQLGGVAQVTPYGMPCSACIEEWGVKEDGSTFYGVGVTEYEVFLAWLYNRDETDLVLRAEALVIAHDTAVAFHAAQRNGTLVPSLWVPRAQ